MQDMEVSMMQTAEVAFRRYRLNQWVRTDGESWLPKGAWELCRSEDELDPNIPVFVGIDMALKHDSIAVGCTTTGVWSDCLSCKDLAS